MHELTGVPARLPKLRRRLETLQIPAFLTTHILNVRYLTGFTGSTAQVLITPTRALLFVDSRYYLQAGQEAPHFEMVRVESPRRWHEVVADAIRDLSLPQVHFDAALSYADYQLLAGSLAGSGQSSLQPARDVVEAMRLVKDAEEVARIRAAAAVADGAWAFLLGVLRPGITEREVAAELECYLRREHGVREAFETIVASGHNAASPHARATGKVIQRGELVKVDFGVLREGYVSDITRTVAVGCADDQQRAVHHVVLAAQEAAIAAIRPGVAGSEVDRVARDLIAAHGYGGYFGHGLGHSIGLSVHDGTGFSPNSEVVLEPGMVMTVEPGIYIPGWGGIRIEDDVLVTAEGAEVLTRASKAFTVVATG